MNASPGFSLVEMLVVMSVLVVLIGVTAVLGNASLRFSTFERVRETVRSELVSAQADTMNGTQDSVWGVALFPGSMTRYAGASYATRNTAFDRTTDFDDLVVLSGASEVSFSRPHGIPLAPATIVLTEGFRQATATINAAGAIDVR